LGAASLALGGIAAAFAVAACCALPIMFASAGISAVWLGSVGMVGAAYRTPLLAIGALCLLAGTVLLVRQQLTAAHCGPDGGCTPPVMRIATLIGLLIGAALLWLGYRYV
jgi:mercuric ion transport protein